MLLLQVQFPEYIYIKRFVVESQLSTDTQHITVYTWLHDYIDCFIIYLFKVTLFFIAQSLGRVQSPKHLAKPQLQEHLQSGKKAPIDLSLASDCYLIT